MKLLSINASNSTTSGENVRLSPAISTYVVRFDLDQLNKDRGVIQKKITEKKKADKTDPCEVRSP